MSPAAQVVLATLAGLSIGLVAGALVLCVWVWRDGASADPRCVFGMDGYFVVLQRLDSGADQAHCVYKPSLARGAP
jgi:hypothetical protein